MKPKTKLECRVMDLFAKLPAITDDQKAWAFENCFERNCYKTKKYTVCFECGHCWDNKTPKGSLLDSIAGITCPNCGKELKPLAARTRHISKAAYFCIMDSIGGFQVVRNFMVEQEGRVGKVVDYSIFEAFQNWISPEGKQVNVARQCTSSPYYYDSWIRHSDMEVRKQSSNYGYTDRYSVNPFKTYPKPKYSEKIKRNGFKKNLNEINSVSLFKAILSDPKAETLLKCGQISMLKQYIGFSSHRKVFLWDSVKICIRNGYKVKDASMWMDYIGLLEFFGKDLRNAKHVCPADLKTEHDRLVEKKRRIEKKQAEEKRRKRIAEAEEKYKQEKGKFFGISFSDGIVKVVVLDSVHEIMVEGDTMKHCVFASEYYNKPDSLILSARVGDERVETVEVSLSKMQVVQCRGRQNANTEYHDQIISLVERNIKQIHKRQKIAV